MCVLTAQLLRAATAPRIVSLSPHITELLYAAGAGPRLVGTVAFSDYPEAARRLPKIGDASSADVEAISALAPTLIIFWTSGTPLRTQRELARLNLPMLGTEQRRLDDIGKTLLQFGAYAESPAHAARAAAEFRDAVQQRRRHYAGARVLKVFYQVWDRPLFTLSGAHIASEVFEICGGHNVFADLKGLAPVVDVESVIARDPDVILIGAEGAEGERQMHRWLHFHTLRASRERAIYLVPPTLLNRMTPRIVDGIDVVCDDFTRARRAP
jgi:iron complex transport system substrate-binding protein